MDSSQLPFPGLFGPGRLARWRRSVVRRVLAAACAALAVGSAVQALRPTPPAASTEAVLVAARSHASGVVLTTADVRLVHLPSGAGPPGAYVAAEPVLGRMTAAPLARGEALTPTRLVPRGPADGLPSGFAAVHVAVADPGTLALVGPGQRVSLHAPSGTVLARDVLVLAVDPPRPGSDDTTTALRGLVLALPDRLAPSVVSSQVGAGSPVGLGVSVVPTR